MSRSRVEYITPATWKPVCGECGAWFVTASRDAGFVWLQKHMTGLVLKPRH